MEVGKLVTSEECGSIFYFVVDETHPDEPQEDASKYYYIVAPAVSTFSYREAYCVLCRALCGLENRTYLHRWHSLYEQIFGTTPYVQFVNAVRDSPLTQPNKLTHDGGDSAHTAATSTAAHAGLRQSVVLPALFLDEETARLVLRKAERERHEQQQPVADTKVSHLRHAPSVQQHQVRHNGSAPLHGCSTPVSTPQHAKRVSGAPPVVADAGATVGEDQKTANGAKVQPLPAAAPSEKGGQSSNTAAAAAAAALQEQKLDTLLGLATRWQESAAALHDEDRRTKSQLQLALQRERQARLEAEEKCLLQTRALEEARSSVQQDAPRRAAASAAISATEGIAEHLREVQQLRQRVQELEAELVNERHRHAQECDRLLSEKESVKQELWQQSQAQGTQIRDFLQANAGAVRRVEEALEKREKELCAVYTKALEERDVRIAQLSQEVLQHLHHAREVTSARTEQDRYQAERVAHLEEVSSQLKEWNVALRRKLADAAADTQELRLRLDEERRAARGAGAMLTGTAASSSSNSTYCEQCGGLPHTAAVQLANRLRDVQQELQLARQDAARKADELQRAAQVIEQLTHGVRKAKVDVEAAFLQHARLTIARLPNASALQNTV